MKTTFIIHDLFSPQVCIWFSKHQQVSFLSIDPRVSPYQNCNSLEKLQELKKEMLGKEY